MSLYFQTSTSARWCQICAGTVSASTPSDPSAVTVMWVTKLTSPQRPVLVWLISPANALSCYLSVWLQICIGFIDADCCCTILACYWERWYQPANISHSIPAAPYSLFSPVCTFQTWMSALCLRSPVTSCVKTQRAATSAPAPEDTTYSQTERLAKVDGLLICLFVGYFTAS